MDKLGAQGSNGYGKSPSRPLIHFDRNVNLIYLLIYFVVTCDSLQTNQSINKLHN